MIADKEPISNNEMILTRMVEQYQLPLLKLCRIASFYKARDQQLIVGHVIL